MKMWIKKWNILRCFIMVFLEFIQALVSLDIAWLINLVLGNLFFVFAFMAVASILYEKNVLFYFLVVTGLIWITGDFSVLFGWTAGLVPVLFLVWRAIVHSFDNVKSVVNNMTLFMTTAYYVALTLGNMFILGNPFILPWESFPMLTVLTLLATLTIHFIDVKTTDQHGILNQKPIPTIYSFRRPSKNPF